MGDAWLPEPQDGGPVRFPQEWTVFARDPEPRAPSGRTLDMGAERGRPLFAVRVHEHAGPAPAAGRPALVLHPAGDDGARLGLVRRRAAAPGPGPGPAGGGGGGPRPARRLDFDVVVPRAGRGRLGRHGDDEDDAEVRVRARVLALFPVHGFAVPVGGPGGPEPEGFEWRHAFGEEVGGLLLGGGLAAGWELVRTGPRSVAAGGRAGDGQGPEVVAVWVAGRKKLNEAMKFRFLNAGASDGLGDSFRYAAVMSALGMWDHIRRDRQKSPRPDRGGG